MEPRPLARCTGLQCRSACEGSALLECQVKRGLCSADPLCLLSGGVCMQVPSLIPRRVRQASLLRVSNAGIPKGCLGGMEARFAGGVCLLLKAICTFGCPGGISPPPVPKIYVADESNNRIVRMDGMPGAGWTPFGVFGSGPNQFRFPSGIFVSAAGQIFVTDAFNHRIVRMDNMTGAGWITLGGPAAGSGMSQFNAPFGIFVSAGQIYVADTSNHRIVRMDDMTGAGWTVLGSSAAGSDKNQFSFRTFVLARAGRIDEADSNNNVHVQMNDRAGLRWTSFGSIG